MNWVEKFADTDGLIEISRSGGVSGMSLMGGSKMNINELDANLRAPILELIKDIKEKKDFTYEVPSISGDTVTQVKFSGEVIYEGQQFKPDPDQVLQLISACKNQGIIQELSKKNLDISLFF